MAGEFRRLYNRDKLARPSSKSRPGPFRRTGFAGFAVGFEGVIVALCAGASLGGGGMACTSIDLLSDKDEETRKEGTRRVLAGAFAVGALVLGAYLVCPTHIRVLWKN